jgi:hypothetical protein
LNTTGIESFIVGIGCGGKEGASPYTELKPNFKISGNDTDLTWTQATAVFLPTYIFISCLFRHCTYHINRFYKWAMIMLWKVVPFLGNDRELRKYTTAVVKYWL